MNVFLEVEADIDQIEDAISGIMQGGTGLTATQDDTANTLTRGALIYSLFLSLIGEGLK